MIVNMEDKELVKCLILYWKWEFQGFKIDYDDVIINFIII